MKEGYPLTSCICVTYRKPALLVRAISCFESQTYKNKELVILYENHDEPTVEYMATHTLGNNIRTVCVTGRPKKTLGELRNIAIQETTGEFICKWDNDDWYHPDRLFIQYATIKIVIRVGQSLHGGWYMMGSWERPLFLTGEDGRGVCFARRVCSHPGSMRM